MLVIHARHSALFAVVRLSLFVVTTFYYAAVDSCKVDIVKPSWHVFRSLRIDVKAHLIFGLGWLLHSEHSPYAREVEMQHTKPVRRPGFPSWSWLSWKSVIMLPWANNLGGNKKYCLNVELKDGRQVS